MGIGMTGAAMTAGSGSAGAMEAGRAFASTGAAKTSGSSVVSGEGTAVSCAVLRTVTGRSAVAEPRVVNRCGRRRRYGRISST